MIDERIEGYIEEHYKDFPKLSNFFSQDILDKKCVIKLKYDKEKNDIINTFNYE